MCWIQKQFFDWAICDRWTQPAKKKLVCEWLKIYKKKFWSSLLCIFRKSSIFSQFMAYKWKQFHIKIHKMMRLNCPRLAEWHSRKIIGHLKSTARVEILFIATLKRTCSSAKCKRLSEGLEGILRLSTILSHEDYHKSHL